MWKFALIIIPLILFLATSLLLPIAIRRLPPGLIGVSVVAFGGILVAFCLSYAIEALCLTAGVPQPNFGMLAGLAKGAAIGLSVSLVAGFSFQLVAAHQSAWSKLIDDLHLPMLLHVFPAANEEVTFRYGIVHAVGAMFGTKYSLLAGSVPFGLLHFLGRLFGNPANLQQVLGASLGGLLLSIIYVRYGGLLACVACHWIWNTMGEQWVKVYALNPKLGASTFEGAWTTAAVLVVACGVLLLLWRVDP
jgi:membrane protease YdiL (CAAX protease family)